MKQTSNHIEHEIVTVVMHLLEKSGFESFTALTTTSSDDIQSLEATLINLKNLAARYDKQDALIQVRTLMQRYNIQVDELVGNYAT
ncbi:MAG TPA: hypothetical protein VD816_13435 [Ohtaekwangia sp.]|nr:hypothetical protein [Ohtaekwangia sp.]